MNSYVRKYEPSAKPHMLKYRAVTVLSFALEVREGHTHGKVHGTQYFGCPGVI